MSDSQRQGAKAEQHVKEILIRHGWRLLDQNWRCRYGEIDLLLTKKHSMNKKTHKLGKSAQCRLKFKLWSFLRIGLYDG